MKAIDDGYDCMFFRDAPGGTGKTFHISFILATVRARSEISAAIASHPALNFPLNLQAVEEPVCNIVKHSAMAKVLVESKIII